MVEITTVRYSDFIVTLLLISITFTPQFLNRKNGDFFMENLQKSIYKSIIGTLLVIIVFIAIIFSQCESDIVVR